MKKLFALIIAFSFLFAYTNAQEATQKTIGTQKSETQQTEQAKPAEKKTIQISPSTTSEKQKTAAKTSAKTKPIKGTVISFSDFVIGGKGAVTKDEAIQLAEKGSPLVFLTGTGKNQKIYFVFNEDGSFAGKNLAKYASNKAVGIIGKTKTVKGMNIIIAQMIESMD